MKEIDYDMNGNVRKGIDEGVVDEADIIVSFKSAEELPEFVRYKDNVRYWKVADPAKQSIEFHREIRDLVKSKVDLYWRRYSRQCQTLRVDGSFLRVNAPPLA